MRLNFTSQRNCYHKYWHGMLLRFVPCLRLALCSGSMGTASCDCLGGKEACGDARDAGRWLAVDGSCQLPYSLLVSVSRAHGSCLVVSIEPQPPQARLRSCSEHLSYLASVYDGHLAHQLFAYSQSNGL